MNFILKRPYILALFIVIALAAWLFSEKIVDVLAHQEKISEEIPVEETIVPPKVAPIPIQVRIREQKAQPLTREIILTGRTAPFRIVTLRTEVDAHVEKIGAKRGARVKKGELIVRLATDDRALRLKGAQALVKQREFEYKAKKNLSKRGYQSQVQIAEALTLLENAKTQVKQAQIALENLVIRAPFSGILEQRLVEKGDYVSIGDTIAELIDENPFLLKGEVTERQRQYLKLKKRVTARLVTGQTVKGRITLISARANESTRTFDIEIEVPNRKGRLAAGITCEIRIPIETVNAHKVSSALLSLNDDGVLGVKTVSADNYVNFFPAKFARANTEGLWLTGLPKQLSFITVGQGFVRPGDIVQPVLESEIASKK
ncbi:efflux RND transporter periplasmic adaptor subunit [Candidatus Parabeggiatoa sp. HSG14]|uniref:efflux RND transporter periplasmic adaptor subunit n=1 Tax=Candidatus Parabeggiatoa sp. HSG14 TaxID=3055593 RepID=UPI0025A86A34|nr:efflux RND transporter periplasmic adaptor subunit [Thiotrichales bacterium HSG14]